MMGTKDMDVRIDLELPKVIRHKGKQYKLYDREAFGDDKKKIQETVAIGKKNGFDSIVVEVSAPRPLEGRLSYFHNPCFLIYYRKSE